MKRGYSLGALLIATSIFGCGGNTHGGADDSGGGAFVGDANSTGSIEIRLASDSVETGQTTEFLAFAFTDTNTPIPSIPIVCDSEEEVAIVDPTSGKGITNSRGAISGLIGCNSPGSFQFGCRLASAGGIRQFISVRCVGDVPEGFSGFTGAGGGGLGGGVIPPNQGGPGGSSSDQIRISGLSVVPVTGGSSGTSQVDTTSCTCDNGTPADLTDDTSEAFGDDLLKISVINNSSTLVRFTKMNYTVSGGQENGGSARSPDLNLIGESASAQPNSSVQLSSVFLAALGGRKNYGDGSTRVPVNLGFKNVTVRLYGTTSSGESFVLTGSTALSFEQLNSCGTGSCR